MRSLRAERYAKEASPALAKFIVGKLPFLSYSEAIEFYADFVPRMKKPDLALLGCNDRFFLLTGLLNRPDALHPWLYERAREVESDPDGKLDLWGRGHYKAVDVDEPVPTPTGWRRHGDLEPGDEVFGPDGEPTKVLARTPIFADADCYRVKFNDGYSVVVSGEHLWTVNLTTVAPAAMEGWRRETLNTWQLSEALDGRNLVHCPANPTLTLYTKRMLRISKVEQVPVQPVSCIQVAREDGLYLIGENYVTTHNSTIITFAGLIQEVLCDPEISIGIFSNTKAIAQPFLNQIKEEFEMNERLIDIYSDVLWESPRKEAPSWSVDRGIIVKRTSNPKEATIEAHGLIDGMPTGRHFKLLAYDDIITERNITNPEQIRKATERVELSDNLGVGDGTRKQFVGTRYHFGDSYAHLITHDVVVPRVYPATDDGTLNGNPVFLSQEAWEIKKRSQRSQISAQMLQNPIAGEENLFHVKWLKPYWVRPLMMNVYIMGDPSQGRSKSSDRTALAVIGIDAQGNKFFLDGYCHRMPLSERWKSLRSLFVKWSRLPGVQSIDVGYERYGMQADQEYFEEKMQQEGPRFEIKTLNWTGQVGQQSKTSRVGRLEPDMRSSNFFVPAKVWHTSFEHSTARWFVDEEKGGIDYRENAGMHREERRVHSNGELWRRIEPLRRVDEDGNIYDLTRLLFEEVGFFPFAPRDDLVDAVSRIYDMDARSAVVHEVYHEKVYEDA